jgi:uncharacterized protein with beta-barrel porin domain
VGAHAGTVGYQTESVAGDSEGSNGIVGGIGVIAYMSRRWVYIVIMLFDWVLSKCFCVSF